MRSDCGNVHLGDGVGLDGFRSVWYGNAIDETYWTKTMVTFLRDVQLFSQFPKGLTKRFEFLEGRECCSDSSCKLLWRLNTKNLCIRVNWRFLRCNRYCTRVREIDRDSLKRPFKSELNLWCMFNTHISRALNDERRSGTNSQLYMIHV